MIHSKGTIVVKIGASCIIRQNNKVSLSNLAELAETIAELSEIWERVVLVSSGAIVIACQHLKVQLPPQNVTEKQALASVGQLYLMNTYREFFDRLGVTVGQVLISKSDFGEVVCNENILNTFENLFKLGVIPIVNENDTVATEEIKYGDNDELSALVAGFLEAEWLFILTNHEGIPTLSDSELQIFHSIQQLETLQNISKSINSDDKYANLKSKIKAAEIAASRKVKTLIINGNSSSNIIKVLSGENIGTKIDLQDMQYLSLEKFRLKYASRISGKIYINESAKVILQNRGSLSSTGVIKIEGLFLEQSVVSIYDKNEEYIAKGVVEFSSQVIESIKGMKPEEIDHIYPNNEIMNYRYVVLSDQYP
jgi:glutamate 5-kinase